MNVQKQNAKKFVDTGRSAVQVADAAGVSSITRADYIFDKQDADLFLVEDRDLRVRAIRCSLVPRLLELANSAIAEAAELFDVEPLEMATLSYSPYRTESRGHGFEYDCKSASAGLAPIRRRGFYPLLGENRMIFPADLKFVFYDKGLRVMFRVHWRNESPTYKHYVANAI